MSVRFSSNANVLSATTGLPGTTYTYTMWVYRTTTRGGSYSSFCDLPASTGSSASTWQYAGFDGANTSIMFAHSPTAETAGFATSTGTWYRVAVVRNGTSITLYRAAATGSIGAVTATVGSLTPAKIYIGGSSYSGEWLNGRIAAFKLWNAALSAVEVEAEFDSYTAQRTANLLRCHPFQTNTADISGNGYTLANNGSAPTFEADPPIATTVPITASDSLTISDAAGVAVPVAAADSVTVTEDAKVGIPTPAADGATFTDTASIAGTLTAPDPVSVTDTLGIAGTITTADSATITDLAKVGPKASDSLAVSDQVSSLVGWLGAAQPVAITDGVAIETLFGDLVIAIWAVHPTTGVLVPLPDYSKLDLSRERNGAGSISLDYPADGLNFNILRDTITSDRDLEVEIWTIGQKTGALRGFLQEATGDDVVEDRGWSFAGGFGELRLGEAKAFPAPIITTTTVTTTTKLSDDPASYRVVKKTTVASSAGGPPVTSTVTTTEESGSEGTTTDSQSTKGDLEFAAVTPGELANTLLDQAQTRGALAGMLRGFTNTHDSAGVAWPQVITTKFSPGSEYDSILNRLVEFGLAEWGVTWTGTAYRLDLWVIFNRGVDRTVGDRPIILRKARNLLDAPRKWSVRDSGTTLLAAGSEGVYQQASDADALARRGRRIEMFASASNLTEPTAVQAFAQNQLQLAKTGKLEVNHGIGFLPGEPRPIIAFDIGDWIYSQSSGGLERLRVVQWTLSVDDSGPSGTVTLNDTITDALSRLQARIDNLVSGDTVVGTSTGSGGQDTSTPLPPEVLSAESIAFLDGTLGVRAAVTVALEMPVLNVDGTVITDMESVVVQYALATSPDVWNAGITKHAPTTSAVFTTVAGQTIYIRAAVVDRNGNTSVWSESLPHTTSDDDIPPPVPSSAAGMTEFLGTVRIPWDGLTADGAVMYEAAIDFDYVEVHLSPGSLFTPTSSTLVGRMYGRGTFTVTDLPYGVTQFARFVAVDWSGNKSEASGQGSATPAQVVSADVFDGAIGSAKLADLAVVTAKIANLAVNDAKIGSLSVGKLISGTVTADMLLSGSVKTATTGNRVEMDSAGLRLYNGTNVVVDLKTSNGSALVVGEFRTSLTGQRIVFNPGGSLADTMNFYPSGAGDFARIMARTAPGDGTAAILIDGGAANGASRGRIGAYRSEAFISHVTNDAGGDTSAGYSRTAVSASTNTVLAWVQTEFDLDKYSGSSRLSASRYAFKWTNGEAGNNVPTLVSENGSGIKLDSGAVGIVNGAGSGYVPCLAASFTVSSSEEVKDDIGDIRTVLDPLDVIKSARAKKWRYRDEVGTNPDAPVRLGPIAEDLPEMLQRELNPTGEAPILGVDLGAQIGLLWGAFNQQLEQQIVSTSAVAVLPSNLLGPGGIFPAQATREVAVTWESTPPAAPTGGFVTINSAFLWAGKVTAWIKTGSVTAQGCTVVFKNISTSQVVTSLTVDVLRVTANVVGLGLWSPPYTGG